MGKPGRTHQDWQVRVPTPNLDHRTNPLSDRGLRLMLVLETFARSKSSCHPSNATLAAMTGKGERAVQKVLRELQSAGWIRCDHGTADGKTTRLRIDLLRRLTAPIVPSSSVDSTDGIEALRVNENSPRRVNENSPELGLRATEQNENRRHWPCEAGLREQYLIGRLRHGQATRL